ncbi:MAG: hypothetical protein RBR71_10540 [Gudongella sp.]|nr:hypothetical protein [Gudongella sp.]
MEKDQYLIEDLTDLLLESSSTGKLTTLDEILIALENDDQAIVESAIESLQEELDLKTLKDKNGQVYYYSGKEMTDKYANILIRIQDKDMLRLVASTVREESRRYPRPTYVNLFTIPPYNLTEEELRDILLELSDEEEFNDLKFTESSNGVSFLYSQTHLSAGYASYLAEWQEVGQYEIP